MMCAVCGSQGLFQAVNLYLHVLSKIAAEITTPLDNSGYSVVTCMCSITTHIILFSWHITLLSAVS